MRIILLFLKRTKAREKLTLALLFMWLPLVIAAMLPALVIAINQTPSRVPLYSALIGSMIIISLLVTGKLLNPRSFISPSDRDSMLERLRTLADERQQAVTQYAR